MVLFCFISIAMKIENILNLNSSSNCQKKADGDIPMYSTRWNEIRKKKQWKVISHLAHFDWSMSIEAKNKNKNEALLLMRSLNV